MPRIWQKMMIALIAALCLRSCVVETFRVSGHAMVPAAFPGDVILVNKLFYGFRVPGSGSLVWQWRKVKVGEVVVLSDVGDPTMTVLRRVVGVHGDYLILKEKKFRKKYFDGTDSRTEIVPCVPIEGSTYCEEHNSGVKYVVRMPNETEDFTEANDAALKRPSDIFVLSDDRRDGPDGRHFRIVKKNRIVGKASHIVVPAKIDTSEATDPVVKKRLMDRKAFMRIQ